MPGETGGMVQDVSGIPADDTMAQLLLKRRLAQADALRQQQMPEGQMVSGHYVAPNWMQQLSAFGNQLIGKTQEDKALKQYGEYQAGKQKKYAEALTDYEKSQQGTPEVTQGSYQIQVPGESTPTSPWTSEQGPNKTIDVPMATTKMRPQTAQERTASLLKFAQATQNPELIQKAILGDIEYRNKQEETAGERSWREQQTKNEQEYNRIRDKERQGFELTQQENQFKHATEMQKSSQGFQASESAKQRQLQRDIHSADSKAPPSGYTRNPDGSLTFIPGGPADPNTKPLTADQSNARIFGTRMEHSNKIATDLEGDLSKPGAKLKYDPIATRAIVTGGKGLSDITYYAANPDTQAAATAMRDFINAALRRESGAAISASEYDSAIQNYFPQPGEDPSVSAQKRKNREIVIQGMREAGGYPRGQSAQPTQKRVVRTGVDKSTGRKVIQYEDGTTAYAN